MEGEMINLENFSIVKDENGRIIQESDFVYLRNNHNGEIKKIHFDFVASHFRLAKVSLNEEHQQMDMASTSSHTDINEASFSGNFKAVKSWTVDETKLMLNLYEEGLENIGPLKKFKNKKQLWEEVASEMSQKLATEFSAVQVQNRFKNVSRKNKQRINHNRKSGNSIMMTAYDREMDKIAALDDSIDPPLLVTQNKIIRKPTISESSNNSVEICGETEIDSENSQPPSNSAITPSADSPSPVRETFRKRSSSYQEKLLEIFEKSREERKAQKAEEGKERKERHEEKMQKISKLTDILSELVKSMKEKK